MVGDAEGWPKVKNALVTVINDAVFVLVSTAMALTMAYAKYRIGA